MDRRRDDQHLKDLIFRGTFLVILVYVLVFIYNSGLINKLRPVKKQAVVENVTPIPNPQEEPSQSSQSDEVYNDTDAIE